MNTRLEKIKSEKGSIAAYVGIVLFSMLIILSAIFLVSTAGMKSQISTAIKVKESYQADNNRAPEIYQYLISK